MLDLGAGRWSPELRAWFRDLLHPSQKLLPNVFTYLQLLRDCNTATLLTSDYGFEAGLHYLGAKCMQANLPSSSTRDRSASTTERDSSEPRDVLAALSWDLASSVCQWPAVSLALKAGQDSSHVGFPKFQALSRIIEDMGSKKDRFHGIVFVRQRQGVHAVAGMLRNMTKLSDRVQFHTFTGHPAKTKAQLMREGADTGGTGMPTRQQQEALNVFKHASGREILVATAAAQEGLDIVNCSFVICYNVTECGIQLMQWRGRTRMFDSQILMVMEAGSPDDSLYQKACIEEANSLLAQLRLAKPDMQQAL